MSSTPQAPQTPQAPSVGDQINSYISSLPSLVSASNQYSPQIAAQSTAITAQNAPTLANLQNILYPQLSNLQASNASFINQNETNGLPPALQQQYTDLFRSQVGDQNGAGIGADYVSRNVLAQNQAYQSNYAQLANAATGNLPLYNVQSGYGQAPNIASTYTPGQALSYGQGTYGSYASAYANMYGSNAQLQGSTNQLIGNAIGGVAGGAGSYFGAAKIAAAL